MNKLLKPLLSRLPLIRTRLRVLGKRSRERAAELGAAAAKDWRSFKLNLRSAAARLRKRLRWLPRIESLKIKLILASSTVAVAILAITYSTLSAKVREVSSEQAQQHILELLNYFSGTFAEAVAANDRIQVNLLAKALLANGVQGLEVTDREGRVLFSSRAELEAGPPPPSAGQKPFAGGTLGTVTGDDGKTFLHAATPIRFGESPVGKIHLWLDRKDLEGRIHRAHSFIYPIFISGFLLMLFLGIFVLETPFRALKRLTLAAERIGGGDLTERVPVQGRDEVARFCQAFNTMVESLCQAHGQLLRRNLETIQAMISTVEAKDSYTQGHCVRVQAFAGKILERFEGFPPEERARIETAALLHDIGKIGIPDSILLKENRLNQKEMEVVRSHVLIGEKILLHLDSMKEIARWVRHHHERWDGLGYPDGLRGQAIPFGSRVIGVADVLDAMLTDRPYRKALTPRKAIEALTTGRGTQFDPEVVDRAVAFMEELARQREEVEVYA